MKRILSLFGVTLLAVTLSSCDLLRPKQPDVAAYDPYGTAAGASPYGQQPATNAYGQAPASPYGAYDGAQATPATPYSSYSQPTPYTQPDPAPAPSYSGGSSYTVQKGDTLWAISRKTGKSVAAIKSANGMVSDNINAGQTIRIP